MLNSQKNQYRYMLLNQRRGATAPYKPALVEPETQNTAVKSPASGNVFVAQQSSQVNQVGNEYPSGNISSIVFPIKLPFVPPGETITAASVSFYLVDFGGTPTFDVDLYGLARSSATTPDWHDGDFYAGTNDASNTKLLASIIPHATAAGGTYYTCSSAALVTWLQGLYTTAGNHGLEAFYGFLRLSPNTASPAFGQHFDVATSNHLTRAYWPVLNITTSGTPTATAGQLIFTFYLPQNAYTSAGVYDTTTGKLLRTIWGNVPYAGGSNVASWDGKDDSGTTITGSHTIKLLTHNVGYTWEGIVGNNSASQTGTSVWRGLDPIQCMSFGGGVALASTGYMEQISAMWSFTEGSINTPTQLSNLADFRDIFGLCANDGTRTYFARSAGSVNDYLFVGAVINSTGAQYHFTSPTTLNPHYDGVNNPWQYVADYDGTAGQGNPATSIAVDGTNLYVGHPSTNEIRVFDKLSGVAGTSITTFTAPGPFAWDTTHYLYVYTPGNNDIEYYDTTNGINGGFGLASTLVEPLAIGVLNGSGTMIVVDGGTSQQVKVYLFDSGLGTYVLKSTTGTAGGQPSVGPTLTNTDFWFGSKSAIAAQSLDNSFWVYDSGNERWMHYSVNVTTGALTFVESFEFRGANYVMSADCNDPTRVFSGFFEYQMDYTHSLSGSTGWKKVKNWLANLTADGTHDYTSDIFSGLVSTVTMSNGRTYSLAFNATNSHFDCIELTSTGPRVTNVSFSGQANRLYSDGSYRHLTYASSVNTFLQKSLTGFDGSNNPTFGTDTTLATATTVGLQANLNTYNFLYDPFVDKTTGGIYPVYRADLGLGYHLGGIAAGGTDWLWQAMPACTMSGRLTISAQPVVGTDSLTLDGLTYIPKASGATGTQFNLGASVAATIANLGAVVNAHSTNTTATWTTTDITFTTKNNVAPVGATSTFGSWNQNIWSGKLSYAGGAIKGGGYDIGNNVPSYGGNIMQVAGRTILLGYHGEGWKNSEANLWYHYDETGLPIGYFGAPGVYNDSQHVIPFEANNSFYSQVVTENGNTHFYYNVEGSLGGLGRVGINNLSSISVLTGTGTTGSVITLS